MSDDEKTTPGRRAVQRTRPVTEVETRKVAAVKRRPRAGPLGVEERLVEPFRVLVLRRGELPNAAGEPDNGWVIRDDYEDSDCLRFVLAAEPLLDTIARTLWRNDDFFFDIMDGPRARGALVLDAVKPDVGWDHSAPPSRGSGALFDEHGQPRASFVIRTGDEVTCYAEGDRAPLLEVLQTRGELLVKARRLTIAHVTRVMTDGLIPRLRHLEVALEKSATPFERLCLVAGLTLSDAWALERSRHGAWSRSDNRWSFGDDDEAWPPVR